MEKLSSGYDYKKNAWCLLYDIQKKRYSLEQALVSEDGVVELDTVRRSNIDGLDGVCVVVHL